MMTTTVFPLFSGLHAMWMAALMAAPDDIPTNRPSVQAACRAVAMAVSDGICTTSLRMDYKSGV